VKVAKQYVFDTPEGKKDARRDNAAKEVCPIWPGQPMTAHWGLPDPAKAEGSEAERNLAFADTLRMLNQRIGIFVSLPIDKLSK
jgi:arsenate reductase (thioredoxin)